MKKIFETPKLEMVRLGVEDIILSSYDLGEDELPPF